MTFTRTASGVSNYRKFFGVDIILFAEGKTDNCDPSQSLPDEIFYLSVFKAVNPKWRVKVKCVGNRDAALKYVTLVKETGTANNLIAIDKDNFGITASYLESPHVIRTHGYSWENDLCTYELAAEIVKDLTLSNPKATLWFSVVFRQTQKRLRFLSALDVSCQIDGKCLLPKTSATGGITFRKSTRAVIPSEDIRRLAKKYRSAVPHCPVVRQVRISAHQLAPEELIQGHLWEYAVRLLISIAATNATGMPTAPRQLLLNLLLSKFAANPAHYLGAKVFNHYQEQIVKRVH